MRKMIKDIVMWLPEAEIVDLSAILREQRLERKRREEAAALESDSQDEADAAQEEEDKRKWE